MADYTLFRQHYKSYISTFKETSFDSHNSFYLCKDESVETINFDKIIEEKYPDSNTRPQSFDSIYLDKERNTIYLVEFKNEKKPEKKEVEGKLLNGGFDS